MSENQNPDMLTMFSAALTEIINKAVDKRVESILGTMAAAQFMSTEFDERVKKLVEIAVEEHTCEEPHIEVDDVVKQALSEMDLSDAVEHEFKHNVNWEDYVDERVRAEVEELVPSDDELHDKIREVLNDVTFTVSVD